MVHYIATALPKLCPPIATIPQPVRVPCSVLRSSSSPRSSWPSCWRERLCRAALDQPDRHAALAFLTQALPSLDTPVPGLRNEGLFALHALTVAAQRRPEWTGASGKVATNVSSAYKFGPHVTNSLFTKLLSLFCVWLEPRRLLQRHRRNGMMLSPIEHTGKSTARSSVPRIRLTLDEDER